MTLIDTRHYYLENEELVESKEAKREELKEEAENKAWIKLLLGFGYFPGDPFSIESLHLHCLFGLANTVASNFFDTHEVPLFLKYCCLKIPLG